MKKVDTKKGARQPEWREQLATGGTGAYRSGSEKPGDIGTAPAVAPPSGNTLESKKGDMMIATIRGFVAFGLALSLSSAALGQF